MGSEWKKTTLGKLANPVDGAVDGPFGSNLPASSYVSSGIPVIRGSNLSLGSSRFKCDVFVYVQKDVFAKLKRSECLPDDILFTKKGTLGQTGIVPKNGRFKRYLLSSNQMRLRINTDIADPHYVYYVVSSDRSVEKIKRESESTGVPKINLEYLKNFEIDIPSLKIQKSIVKVLDTLDNKIELNRQINQTLEQMAQALFKSWFVDFDPVIDNALAAGNPIPEELQARAQRRQQQLAKPDHQPLPDDVRQLFPSEFEETEALGWVPKGWISKPFGELLDQTIGGDWGKEVPDDKHTVESVIVRGTDIPHLASGSQSSAPTRWVEPKKLKTRSLSDSDIVIEVSGGSPTQPTGRSIMMTENLLVRLGGTVEPASFCRKFRPINKEIGLVLGLHLQKIYADGKTWEYQNTSTGISNFQTKTFLSSELVLMPDNVELINKFYSLTRPYIDKMTSNDSIKLENLRDTLLPKLISGELRLPESMLDSETNPPAETAYE